MYELQKARTSSLAEESIAAEHGCVDKVMQEGRAEDRRAVQRRRNGTRGLAENERETYRMHVGRAVRRNNELSELVASANQNRRSLDQQLHAYGHDMEMMQQAVAQVMLGFGEQLTCSAGSQDEGRDGRLATESCRIERASLRPQRATRRKARYWRCRHGAQNAPHDVEREHASTGTSLVGHGTKRHQRSEPCRTGR